MFGDFIKISSSIILPTKVALTEKEQQQGLMHVAWPPPNLIFPFKKPKIVKFWMKGTPSPLDIVFAKDNKIIAIYQGEPFNTTLIGPEDKLTDLVAEFPSGTVDRLKISIGQSIQPIYSRETLLRKFSI